MEPWRQTQGSHAWLYDPDANTWTNMETAALSVSVAHSEGSAASVDGGIRSVGTDTGVQAVRGGGGGTNNLFATILIPTATPPAHGQSRRRRATLWSRV